MNKFEKLLEKFNYHIPPELIAQFPAKPRDSARLLVYDRKREKTHLDTFTNIGAYLPKSAVLVFNQTKVIPARLCITKETGGKAELLYVGTEQGYVKALCNKNLNIKSYGTLFHLPRLPRSKAGGRQIVCRFRVVRKEKGMYFLKLEKSKEKIIQLLIKYGKMPLPPYIKHTKLSEKVLQQQYQTVFAKKGLSVAAPTAGLHFTKKLLEKLKNHGMQIAYVNLNVGLGTFAKLTKENVKNQSLHFEKYEIDKKTAAILNEAKKSRQPIFAVGTTVVRTLESAAVKGKLKKLSGQTNLFIQKRSQIHFVDGLITNFHVPKSSLLMLVSAFTRREKLSKLYKLAILKKFRFFSFGDGMLIK